MDWTGLIDLSLVLLLGGLSAIGIFVLVVVIISSVREFVMFRTDGGNPYRRYCCKCGQQQEAYGRSYNKSNWWEDCLPVPDEDCACHSFSEYHR